MTLHASVVAGAEGAALLLGPSGSGKSTLAADLCQNANCSLVADDTAVLTCENGRFHVQPTDDALWIASDARHALGLGEGGGEKSPVQPARVASRSLAVRAAIKLTFDETSPTVACELAPCTGRTAFEVLSRSLFRFVIDEPEVTLADASRLAEMAAKVPLYELRRRRDLSQLPASRAAILDLLGTNSSHVSASESRHGAL
jgi:hypothetical protein